MKAMRTPMYVLGTALHSDDRRHVLATYVHRFTGDHRPAWVAKGMPNGQPYPLHFASDADWLAHTLFRVRTSGRLDMRVRSCESHPTWPNNPELRRAPA